SQGLRRSAIGPERASLDRILMRDPRSGDVRNSESRDPASIEIPGDAGELPEGYRLPRNSSHPARRLGLHDRRRARPRRALVPPGRVVAARTDSIDSRTGDRDVIEITASREQYIDALLAVAGGRARPDLAPAPLFLRKSHLSQRVA